MEFGVQQFYIFYLLRILGVEAISERHSAIINGYDEKYFYINWALMKVCVQKRSENVMEISFNPFRI